LRAEVQRRKEEQEIQRNMEKLALEKVQVKLDPKSSINRDAGFDDRPSQGPGL
jgi:hypothetical protein